MFPCVSNMCIRHLHFLVKLRTMVRAQSGLLGGNDVPVPPVPQAQRWDEGPQLAATQVLPATPAVFCECKGDIWERNQQIKVMK